MATSSPPGVAGKPNLYPIWTDGDPSRVVQPPAEQLLTGWTEGEPPPFEFANWHPWLTCEWIKYLDAAVAQSGPSSLVEANSRLLGGGVWRFDAASSMLSWSAAFTWSTPSLDDAANSAPPDSVFLQDGELAYFDANLPFTTTGNATGGNATLQGLAYTQGILVGAQVSGTNIPDGTTVVSINSPSSVTLSAAATGSATGAAFTFVTSGPLAVSTADSATLVPGPATFIFARRAGDTIVIGIGAGEMVLRPGESKMLRATGYQVVTRAPAGEALAAGQVVYMSSAAEGGRTAGSVYRADASAAQGALRGQWLGVVAQATASGAEAVVVCGGRARLYSGLTPGITYYLDPATPGGITATRPSTASQYLAPVGLALDGNSLNLHPATGAATAKITGGASQGTSGVTSDAELVAALAAAAAAGGGVIVITQGFTVAASRTVPPNTALVGTLGAQPLVLGASGVLAMGTGSVLRDVYATTTKLSGNMVELSGNHVRVNGCRLSPASGTSVNCLYVTGNGGRIRDAQLANCLGDSNTGLAYAGGLDNQDTDTVYL